MEKIKTSHISALAVLVGTWLVASAAFGFNPPSDAAGPLAVRIDGPARHAS